MNQVNSSTKRKKGKHLSLCERKEIEKSLKRGFSIRAIAKALNRSPSTICREINRGNVRQIKTQKKSLKRNYYREEIIKEYFNEYFAETGHLIAKENTSKRGGKYKLFKDTELLRYIEDKILKERASPDAIIGQLKNYRA